MVIAGAVLLAPVAIYVVAYFACTTAMGTVSTGGSARVYRTSCEAVVFMPASFVESAATGRSVTTAWRSP